MRTLPRFIVVIVALVIVLGGLFGWRIYQFGQMSAQLNQPQPPMPVAAVEVATADWIPSLSSVGSLRAVNGVEVANEVAGVVEEILFESGQRVEQGQVLVRLNAATDEAALNTLRAEAKLARTEFDRIDELLKKGAISQSEYDSAQATLDAATARATQQEAQLAKKVIRAPFSGVVGLRLVDVGEYLPAGSPAVEINMLDPIYAEYNVPEKALEQVAVGYPVEIAVAALPEEVFPGVVSAINSSVTADTRTLRVRATLDNPQRLLLPGMFTNIRTLQPQSREVVVIPRTAVSFNTYGNFAFVVKENEEDQLIVERRSLVTGEAREGLLEVVEGLEPGEVVVNTGLLRLRAGQPVQIAEDAAKPSTSGAGE